MSKFKQDMKYNKSFVQVPIQKLVDMIKYKVKLSGIKVIIQKEDYTSRCSVLDLEPINRKGM